MERNPKEGQCSLKLKKCNPLSRLDRFKIWWIELYSRHNQQAWGSILNHDFPIFIPIPFKNFNPWPDWRDVIPRCFQYLRCQYTEMETIHTRRAHTGSEYRDTGGKDGRMETKSRKRHSRKNCAASESEIIPETFEFFGSRLLVKIGHYNAICVTDQRAWNVSTGTVYRQGNKRVKFRVGYRRRSYWLRGSRI